MEGAGGELVTRGHRRVHRVRFGVGAPRGFGGGGGRRRCGRVPLHHARDWRHSLQRHLGDQLRDGGGSGGGLHAALLPRVLSRARHL